MLDISSCYDINQAAEELKITVQVLKMLIADGSAPAHVMHKGKTYFTGNALRSFITTKTILRDGSVIAKVKAHVLGTKKDNDGKERPVLACYQDYNVGGNPILLFIDPYGFRQGYIKEEGIDPSSAVRSPGVFIRETPIPELAGLSNEFLGFNAITPEYVHVR